LANSWVAQGKNVTIVTLQEASSDFFQLDSRVRRIVIHGHGRSSNLWRAVAANFGRIRRLRAALRKSRAETVVSFIGSMNVLTVIAAFGLGQRVVISERNDPARQSLGLIWDVLRRQTYRHADLVVANSRFAVEKLKEYVPAERVMWMPNPLRVPPSTDGQVPVEQPFFLAAGRLKRQKAYDILLAAFADVARELPRWKLVILGDGNQRQLLEQQAALLGISSRVFFPGVVDDPFSWYRKAEIFVHSARFEGMPNVVLEAMSEGLPVIVTDQQAGLQGVVSDGKTGLVVPADSVMALREAMLYLAKSPDFGRRLSQAGRDAVVVFRRENAVNMWTEILEIDPSSHKRPNKAGGGKLA
jgi:glycosyltransferase involved in cell wall biosynthesis